MNMRKSKALVLRFVNGLCYAAVVVVLVVFACRLCRGIGEVKRGEVTPAQMLEQMTDWMTGKEPW